LKISSGKRTYSILYWNLKILFAFEVGFLEGCETLEPDFDGFLIIRALQDIAIAENVSPDEAEMRMFIETNRHVIICSDDIIGLIS